MLFVCFWAQAQFTMVGFRLFVNTKTYRKWNAV